VVATVVRVHQIHLVARLLHTLGAGVVDVTQVQERAVLVGRVVVEQVVRVQ
jgi:hypothetical protein